MPNDNKQYVPFFNAAISYDVVFIVLSVIALVFDLGDLSVILAALAIGTLYQRIRSFYESSDWALHPLRLLIPLTVVFQCIYWIWFGLFANIRPVSFFDWMLPNVDGTSLGRCLSNYLLLHYILFISIEFGMRRLRDDISQYIKFSFEIDYVKFLMISLIVIILANLGNVSAMSGSSVLSYAASITNRVFPTIIGLLCYSLFNFESSFTHRLLSAFLLLSSVVAGFFITLETSMRFMILQQILIILAIMLTMVITFNRHNIAKLLKMLVIAGVCLFYITTVNKFSFSGDDSELQSAGKILQFVFERSIQRLSPFTTDALVKENNLQDVLFSNPEVSIIRIVKAVPFVFNIAGTENSNSPLEIEKLIYNYTNKFEVDSWETSVFISGASELFFSYGIIGGGIAIIFFGLIQCIAIIISARLCGDYCWVNVTSQYVLYALLGMDANSFLRIPINIVFGAILIRVLTSDKVISTKLIQTEKPLQL